MLNKKKEELGYLLQEKVKGALIRSIFCSIKDMDAPSAFFFNLEKKSFQQKQLCHIKHLNGTVIFILIYIGFRIETLEVLMNCFVICLS